MRHSVGIWYGVLFSLLLAGCDLFQTRDAQPPAGNSTPWQNPLTVEQVFLNMKNALGDLVQENYLRCFLENDDPAGPYLFVPDPNTANWPVSLPWGYDQEQQMVQNWFALLIAANSVAIVTWTEQAQISYGNDSVRVTQEYTLFAPTNDSTITLPSEVTGTADFLLARNSSGYWAIKRWEDLEGSPSWTVLKAGVY